MTAIRPLVSADAEELAALRNANRAQIARWEPDTEDGKHRYTVEGVRASIDGDARRYAILDDGAIAGMVVLADLMGLPFHSAVLGYFVDEQRAGRGLATRAVSEIAEVAFREFGLHRIEAGTAVENLASQRVLEKAGFTRIGLMRKHLLIRGVWVDHVLWERLETD